MLVANDGFSAGHVARAIAIARGLARGTQRRGLELRIVLLTTSEADTLLADEPIAIVRLPAPDAGRRAGFADAERRRLASAIVDGVVEGFAPDLVVADTFPSGPHGELAGIGRRAKRALIRRSVPDERADLLSAGLGDYDLAVLADDPGAVETLMTTAIVRVPPITLGGPILSRDDARRSLGISVSARAILIAAGGGGDAAAAARADRLAAVVARISPDVTTVVARGPLDRATPARGEIRIAPLSLYLRAFDGALSPAGYNTAHELASARVPAALFAQPRPYDDQAARATRFADAGFACVLARFDDDAIAAALAWIATAAIPALVADGANRAADALLDLATGVCV